MSQSALPYQLTIDGVPSDSFRVLSITGKETISEAWWFDVVVRADAGETVEVGALGQRATLIFALGDKQRAFYGVVARVRLAEVHVADGSIRYVVRVVPRLWLLKRKTRTRIFQMMRVPDIVSSVLTEAGITTRWQLTRAYPEREFCTQYEETDYHFVRRILAEAGIFFYFFGGGPVSGAALAADAAVGAASAGVGAVASFVGAPAGVGALVGEAAQMAETLIPGDTVVGADDANGYPPVGGDDPAALAASTAAAMAPAIGDALGLGGGVAGAVIGTASAVAGTVIADLTEGGAPVMQFMDDRVSAVERHDKVTRFSLRNAVRSSAATFREFDPDRPQVQLMSTAVSTQPFPPSPFELAAEAAAAVENVAGAAASVLPGPAAGALGEVSEGIATADSVVNEVAGALGQKVPFEIYTHHDPFLFPKWAFGNDAAPRTLRQERRRASIASGEGGCPDFSPAHRFALSRHHAPEVDGAYVLTSVEHRGHSFPSEADGRLTYANTFECAPAQMPYPPPRPRRKCIQVALTATVVGPDDEEIYVDDKGQIKVQFHWDRDGTYDDRSSCWIRTMQPWAGAAWGHQFIPRVGMEVVVTFEGGDPDKPIVLGSVYNATHPSSFQLPRDKTRSGIRTRSTPASEGFNELSFEDYAGGEQVYIHAQRNFDEVVENNHSTKVHGSQMQHVDGDQTERIGVTQSVHVQKDRELVVERNQTTQVNGRRLLAVTGDDAVVLSSNGSLHVTQQYSMKSQGNFSLVVGTDTGEAQSDQYTHGTASIGASERVVVRAVTSLLLSCGDTSIELTPDKMTLHAPTIEIKATKGITATGNGPSLKLDDQAQLTAKSVKVYSESGSLELDKNATMKGTKMMLNCDAGQPSPAPPDGEKPPTQSFSVKLTDYFLNPLANKKYHLMCDGLKYEGQTDGDGTVKQDIPKTARQVNINLWLDEYPEGRQRLYTLSFDDKIPGADAPKGAQYRLKHLGYFWGEPGDDATDEMASALTEFQQDHKDSHGLDPTGQLDGPTIGALKDVYGS